MSLKAMTKKTKYITIAVALCFILAGILICTGVLLATGFDLSKLDNSVYTTSSYEFKDEIDAINIDCAVTDVTIELSKDNLCTVTCFEDETLPHTVTLQEGTLNITSTKTKWYTHIKPFSFKSSAVIICLPEDIYKTLNASVSTGSISLQNISADEIKLTASTGDISIINAKQCENIDATVSTGDINILSTVCNKLTTKATTGSSGGEDKKDNTVNFNELKALIIKSADIVNAYYEKINARLTGEYVAQSDYGTFVELTEGQFKATSTDIEQLFTNLQQIITDIDNVESTLIEVNACIKSGLLYYNEAGIPIFGLEIGQTNEVDGVKVFSQYARFTADRLVFYDYNGREMAYISDKKLYIDNIEVASSFSIGGFVETVQPDLSVVKRWVGGEGQWQ